MSIFTLIGVTSSSPFVVTMAWHAWQGGEGYHDSAHAGIERWERTSINVRLYNLWHIPWVWVSTSCCIDWLIWLPTLKYIIQGRGSKKGLHRRYGTVSGTIGNDLFAASTWGYANWTPLFSFWKSITTPLLQVHEGKRREMNHTWRSSAPKYRVMLQRPPATFVVQKMQ